MKKFVTAMCFILLAGLLLFMVGFSIFVINGGYDMSDLKKIEQEIEFNENSNLTISSEIEDITINVIDGDKIKFSYYENEKLAHSFSNEGNEIELKMKRINWLFNFFRLMGHNKLSVNVGVPSNFKGNLTLSTQTGDVNVNGLSNLKNINIKIATGDATVANIGAVNGEFVATTGDINVENAQFGNDLQIKLTTGDIRAYNVKANNEFIAKATTGDVKCEIDCPVVTFNTSTGDIKFKAINSNAIKVKCSTGSIKGEVVGNEADYDIKSSTTVGKSNLKNKDVEGGKSLNCSTTTGSINVQFIS